MKNIVWTSSKIFRFNILQNNWIQSFSSTSHQQPNISLKINNPFMLPSMNQTSTLSYISINDLENKINLNQDFSGGDQLYQLGNLYYRNGQVQQAIKCYQRAIKNHCKNVDCLNSLGIALIEKGEISEAIKTFQFALKADELDYKIYNNLGVIYMNYIFDIQKALKCFYNSAVINSDNYEYYLQTGEQLLNRQEYQKSLCFLINALFRKLDCDRTASLIKLCLIKKQTTIQVNQFYHFLIVNELASFSTYFNFAQLLLQSGHINQSKSNLIAALHINPSHYKSNLYLGTVFIQQGNLQQAIKYYKIANQLKKDDSTASSSLGVIYMQNNDNNTAEKYFNQSILINPKDGIALMGIGSIKLLKNQKQEGIKYLHKAIEADQNNYPAWKQLAETYFILGKESEAKEYEKLANSFLKEKTIK